MLRGFFVYVAVLRRQTLRHNDAMKQAYSHPWPDDEQGAIRLQQQMAQMVEREDRLGPVRTVAGVDVAYDKHSDRLVAAVVVLDADTLEVIAQASAQDVERFPYVPGLFSFRELPPIMLALAQLDSKPDLIVCDGQGIAHPRRFGLACHRLCCWGRCAIGGHRCGGWRCINHRFGRWKHHEPYQDHKETKGRCEDKVLVLIVHWDCHHCCSRSAVVQR